MCTWIFVDNGVGDENFKRHDAVAETARLTEARPELDEQEQRAINESLAYIADHIQEHPEVKIQYFVPDDRKTGGTIIEVSGKVKKVLPYKRIMVFSTDMHISIIDIIDICILGHNQ